MKKSLLFYLICFTALISKAQPYGSAGEITKVPDGTTAEQPYGYVEYLPTGYDGVTTFPLIISFIGKGEARNQGEDSESALSRVVSKPPINVIKTKAPNDAIVVAPQDYQAGMSSANVKRVYDYAVANYAVDIDRVYLVGFSFGGGNVWTFVGDYPELIAAIVPICGAGKVPLNATYLQTMPCWSHHNFDDPTNGGVGKEFTADNFYRIGGTKANLRPLYENSQGIYPYGPGSTAASDAFTMYMDLTVNGSDTTVEDSGEYGVHEPKQFHAFTLYPNGGHNSWDKTLQNPAVWTWLLKQSKAGVITSTKKLTDVAVEIYPNPSTTQLEVKIPSEIVQDVTSINLNNVNGTLVKSITDNISSNLSINVSKLTSGVYTLTINTGTDSLTQKVVIE